jgi:hypothetical protein
MSGLGEILGEEVDKFLDGTHDEGMKLFLKDAHIVMKNIGADTMTIEFGIKQCSFKHEIKAKKKKEKDGGSE